MTYEELRNTIAFNQRDQEALMDLLTVENVILVQECAQGIVFAPQDYPLYHAQTIYESGRSVSEALYDPKNPTVVNDVNTILVQFSPQNIYPVQFYREIDPGFQISGKTLNTFFADYILFTSPIQRKI